MSHQASRGSLSRRYLAKLLSADRPPPMTAKGVACYLIGTVANYATAAILVYLLLMVANANDLPPFEVDVDFQAPVPAQTISVPTPEVSVDHS